MKKLISLLLAVFMLFSFSSCDISEEDVNNALEIISAVDEVLNEDTDVTEAVTTVTTTETEYSEETTTATTESTVTETTTAEVTTTPEITTTEKTTTTPEATTTTEVTTSAEPAIDYDGVYTKKDDVALYIHTYGKLPKNFISKKEAHALGWSGGSLEPYAPGMCIGGSYFGNYEGLLPEKDGRKYTECDIDTLGKKSRGAKRIVFSNDGLIYYTDDHYESFELLYGEE